MLKENKPFSRKILIFSNFSPLVAVEYIKIFEKLFDFVKAHIKRQLYFAVRWHDSNFYFLHRHSQHPTIHVYTLCLTHVIFGFNGYVSLNKRYKHIGFEYRSRPDQDSSYRQGFFVKK